MSDVYDQICIVSEHIEKTMFSTVVGMFVSNIMQQGDCNAPATFQHLMTHVFWNMIRQSVHVYLDDIFIFGNMIKVHETVLEEVFNCLHKEHLFLSKEKVDLYLTWMDCLGHIVDDLGIHTEVDKMAHYQKLAMTTVIPWHPKIFGFGQLYCPIYARCISIHCTVIWHVETIDIYVDTTPREMFLDDQRSGM